MIELLVVLLLMGMTLLVGLPALRTSLTGHRLRGGAEELQAKMRLARSRAVAEDTPYVCAWNPDEGQLYLVRDDNLDGSPDWGTEPQEGPFKLPRGISLENDVGNPFPNTWVVFNPDGSTDASGTVVLTNEKDHKLYVDVLQPSGVVQIISEKDHDNGI